MNAPASEILASRRMTDLPPVPLGGGTGKRSLSRDRPHAGSDRRPVQRRHVACCLRTCPVRLVGPPRLGPREADGARRQGEPQGGPPALPPCGRGGSTGCAAVHRAPTRRLPLLRRTLEEAALQHLGSGFPSPAAMVAQRDKGSAGCRAAPRGRGALRRPPDPRRLFPPPTCLSPIRR